MSLCCLITGDKLTALARGLQSGSGDKEDVLKVISNDKLDYRIEQINQFIDELKKLIVHCSLQMEKLVTYFLF